MCRSVRSGWNCYTVGGKLPANLSINRENAHKTNAVAVLTNIIVVQYNHSVSILFSIIQYIPLIYSTYSALDDCLLINMQNLNERSRLDTLSALHYKPSQCLVFCARWKRSLEYNYMYIMLCTHVRRVLFLFMQTVALFFFFNWMLLQAVVNIVGKFQVKLFTANITRSKTGRKLNNQKTTILPTLYFICFLTMTAEISNE